MFRFFLKKNFCDVWDNLFHLALINFILTLILAGGFYLCYAVGKMGLDEGKLNLLTIAAIIFICMVFHVFLFAEGDNEAAIVRFETPHFKNYFKNILPSIKDGMLFGFFVAMLGVIAFITLPYYFSIWLPADGSKGHLWGLLLMSLSFWFLVITLLALQWFLPVRSLMGNKFWKCLKKCYLIFFDNTGFSLLLALNNLVMLIITIFTLGLVPGFNGICLANTNALRLRLYKYDWLEVNPGLTRKQAKDVPWDELLAKDKHTLGPRKFKSFIFPWKQD
jgi:hypothetical protein